MPVNLPTAQDVRKARRQATTAVAGALEQARTPLYVALGAGSLASEAVASYARKARGEAYGQAGTAQARVADLQARLTELQGQLTDLPVRLRTRLAEVTEEMTALRGKLDAAELRELADAYRRTMQEVYERLAARGARVYGELAAQPQLKRAVGRVEQATDTAEVRVERFVEEARVIAEDVLARVTRRTRSTGETAARKTEDVATDVADAVVEAGGEVASTTRSVTRKAAERTRPATPATPATLATSKPATPASIAKPDIPATPASRTAGTTRTAKTPASKPATRRSGNGTGTGSNA
jgi:heparin binding hemagglutinin HbhA